MKKINKLENINTNKKGKRGLSNIVGSLLLIVLTIVAALLIGHFVFGLFSANSHNAGISISDASVIIPGGEYTTQGASVTLTVTNSGNDPIIIQTINLEANGNSYALYSASGTKSYITPISGAYKQLSNGYLIEPGQSITFSGIVTSATVPSLSTGQTIVFLVSGVDNVTAQTLSQQISVVVQD
ncbi:archaellin/type IV pilin N-terminal domain-containing protein [Sulfurisphaera ohwakuensis]|uniref:Flagellin-like protein n=1 Tax=Sulfurisphaera ohwakuensis TaxID=69656 RepID=A0A650CGI7_SULOH|nr:archaellin/type IV pilin N-terminal domain-containing protein [Sulfurisphaera ohwakuensis]MBB5252644.1 flagellin-like protein [Sulfurisphaera ohwakuensis]QGR16922.1 type IV pilin [Sulfurisphaera ohwakuensis]